MPLDDADKKAVGDLVAAAIAEAMKTIPNVVAEAVKPLSAKLTEAEAAAKKVADDAAAKKVADDAAAEAAKLNAGGKKTEEKTVTQLKLEEEVAKLKADNQRRIDEAKVLEEKAKADRLSATVRDALASGGVPADRLGPALAVLLAEGRAKYNDKDEPGVEYKRKSAAGEYTEIVTGKESAADWLKTDAGKLFLPPTDVRGTGDRSANGGGGRRESTEPVTEEGLTRGLFGRALQSAATQT